MQKEKKTGAKLRIFLVAFLAVAVIIFAVAKTGNKGKKQSGSTGNLSTGNSFTAEGMNINVSYGYNQVSKYGRDVRFLLDVDNQGEDFSGSVSLRSILSVDYNGFGNDYLRAEYNKNLSVASGGRKQIKLYMPSGIQEYKVKVEIRDEKDKVVGEKIISTAFAKCDGNIYTGIVGDSDSFAGYFSETGSREFHIAPEDLDDDARGLDTLDVIVLKDTGSLNDSQINALKQWVENGGNLVLSGGHSSVNNFEPFSGDILNGTIGELKQYDTAFGYENMTQEQIVKSACDQERKAKMKKIRDFLWKELVENREDYAEYQEYWTDQINSPLEDSTISDYYFDWDGTEENTMNDVLNALVEKYGVKETKRLLDTTLSEKEEKEIVKSVKKEKLEQTIEYVEMELENSSTALTDGKVPLIQRVDYGNGRVFVAQLDLDFDSSLWTTAGTAVRDAVCEQLSDYTEERLAKEEYNGDYISNSYVDPSNISDTESLPKVSVYVIILVIYILVIGPVLYFICKKKDMRHLLWGLIPSFAVIFSLFIYFIGSGTRINHPVLNYITLSELTKEGYVENTTYTSLISPSNTAVDLEFSKEVQVTPVVEYYDYYSYSYGMGDGVWETTLQSNMAFSEGAKKSTHIKVKNDSLFKKTNLEIKEQEKVDGGIEASLLKVDGVLSGKIVNNTGYDLTNVMLVDQSFNGYNLDNLDKGAVFDLASIEEKDKGDYDDLYNLFDVGRDYDAMSSDEKRSLYAVQCYLDGQMYGGKRQAFIIALAKDAPKTTAIDALNLEGKGIRLFIQPIDIEEMIDNERILQNIFSEGDYEILSGEIEYAPYESSYISYQNRVEMQFSFDKELSPSKLIFELENNSNISSQGVYSLYNYETEVYEDVLKGNVSGNVDLENYVNENNQIQILFTISNDGYDEYGQFILPNLSVSYNDK